MALPGARMSVVWYNIAKGKAMKKETQTIEFKQSWHDEYLEWICGYANTKYGITKPEQKFTGSMIKPIE